MTDTEMWDYEKILWEIQASDSYQQNLSWGKSRRGHPEGTIELHILELQKNLNALKHKLTELDCIRLRILIHVHDLMKPNATSGVPILHPSSHASLAREFLKSFCDDPELLEIIQYHDEPYAMWRKYQTSNGDPERLARLQGAISNWDLFLTFLVIDGCSSGKSREPLVWFFDQIQGHIESNVSAEWLL